MTADIVPFPFDYSDSDCKGPTGPVLDEILDQESELRHLLDNYPFGSQFDPRAGVNKITLIELRVAGVLLAFANKLIERAGVRERRYSLDNGWPYPEERRP